MIQHSNQLVQNTLGPNCILVSVYSLTFWRGLLYRKKCSSSIAVFFTIFPALQSLCPTLLLHKLGKSGNNSQSILGPHFCKLSRFFPFHTAGKPYFCKESEEALIFYIQVLLWTLVNSSWVPISFHELVRPCKKFHEPKILCKCIRNTAILQPGLKLF